MSIHFSLIADNSLCIDPLFLQFMIGKHSRARAALAVDESHFRAGQILPGVDILGIARGHHESLFPVGKTHRRHFFAAEELSYIADVVFSVFLQ